MANILKVLKGPLSTLGKKNRNGRVYSKELWEKVLDSEYWKDMIENNTLCGEVVHPGERTESDPFEIDVRNISHRVTEAHIEGDKLIGTVEVLDTEQGRNLASLIDSGCTVGISARGMGDVDGDRVIPDTYNFKCFDITMRPSDPNARLVPLTESEKIKLIIKEADETDLLVSNTKEDDNDNITKIFKVIEETLNTKLPKDFTIDHYSDDCITINNPKEAIATVVVYPTVYDTYDDYVKSYGVCLTTKYTGYRKTTYLHPGDSSSLVKQEVDSVLQVLFDMLSLR